MAAFLRDIKNHKHSKLNHVDTVITKINGEKVNESSGEVVYSSGNTSHFFVVDTTPDENLHKVIDGLFIGSQDSSANSLALKDNKITHILNVGIYCKNHFEEEYIYKNMAIYDNPDFDISCYFEDCSNFINNALCNDGAILCHCNAGISRSATVIIAYLMQYREMTLNQALSIVRVNRPAAKPNVGFIEKLKKLETSLQINKNEC